jgi:DNA-binding transcriptional LysR family regulator
MRAPRAGASHREEGVRPSGNIDRLLFVVLYRSPQSARRVESRRRYCVGIARVSGLIGAGTHGRAAAGQRRPWADWPFRSGKRTIGIRPNGRLHSDNGEVLLRWAVGGLGIAYLPSFEVADAIEHGAVEPLLLDYPAPEVGIYVVRPPGSYVSGKVRLLIDTLVEHFGGEAKWDRCFTALNRREGDGSTPAG